MSYTQADKPWAEWIAWQLEAAGISTVLQAWDFAPGSDWLAEMDRATKTTDRTIAVLSPAYLESEFGAVEWRAAFALDASGEQRRLIPVRVAECDPTGLLRTRTYTDLVGLHPVKAAEELVAALRAPGERAKPTTPPPHPGSRFPGPIRYGIPFHSRFFRGREAELFALEQATAAGSRTLVTQAIGGLGGVGKTQLAAAYVHGCADEFDIVAWVRAEDGGVEDLASSPPCSELRSRISRPPNIPSRPCAGSSPATSAGC